MAQTVTRRAAPLLLLLLAGCDVLFPESVDPCPLPPEQHPEAWQLIPMKDASGLVVSYSYVCVSQ